MTKVHKEARRFAAEDYDILLIGHRGHEEVEGTQGEAPESIQVINDQADVDASSFGIRRRSSGCPRRRCRSTRPWTRSACCDSASR